MKRFTVLTALCLGLVAFTPACGGAEGDAKSASDAEGSPMDQLKAISLGLQADVDGLLKPLDDLDAAIDGVTGLSADLKGSAKGSASIDSKKIMAMAKSLVDTGSVDFGTLGEVDVEVKGKITAAFDKLKACVNGIKTMPEKVQSLSAKVADAIVKVPVLATKVAASAQLSISSPFSKPEVKASAEADLKGAKEIADGFVTKANEWVAKIKDVPAKGSKALEKLAKAFAG